jgi:CheY-like chemotaxis protein
MPDVASGLRADMSGVQVIVAEDEAPLRSLIVEALTQKNLSVLEAADGVEALAHVKDYPGVSLILSDVRMPRMGGYELIDAAIALHPELKALMMTAYIVDQPPPAALRAREIRVLVKPVDLDRLCDMVTDMLSRT